jgi:membrane associated rhomboid family serine protease
MSNDRNDHNGAGHDPKIARFPDKAARAMRTESPPPANGEGFSAAQKVPEPMLNLPAGIKYLSLTLLLLMGLRYVLPDEALFDLYMRFGFVPARYTGVFEADWRAAAAPVTHMFLHGGWLHVGVNIGMLMAFGSALEKTIGLKRAAVIYFASGALGAGLHLAVMPQDPAPLIGASGGISGLFGGMLILMFRSGLLGGEGYRRLGFLIVLWIGISLAFGYAGMPGTEGKVAWTAHVGGFVAGLVLYPLIVRDKNLRLE